MPVGLSCFTVPEAATHLGVRVATCTGGTANWVTTVDAAAGAARVPFVGFAEQRPRGRATVRGQPVMVTGVPSGTRAARRRTTALGTRMHPALTSLPSACGASVPWMPTWPLPPRKEV